MTRSTNADLPDTYCSAMNKTLRGVRWILATGNYGYQGEPGIFEWGGPVKFSSKTKKDERKLNRRTITVEGGMTLDCSGHRWFFEVKGEYASQFFSVGHGHKPTWIQHSLVVTLQNPFGKTYEEINNRVSKTFCLHKGDGKLLSSERHLVAILAKFRENPESVDVWRDERSDP